MEEVYVTLPFSSSRKANRKAVLDYLTARPSVYMDEQFYSLWDTFGVQVDEQCIQCMLKRVK